MTGHADRPYVGALSLTDADAQVYEAIATLEYTGHPVTRAAIVAAAQLDDASVDDALEQLTGRGLVVRSEADGEAVFGPARREWSAAPDQAAGPQRLTEQVAYASWTSASGAAAACGLTCAAGPPAYPGRLRADNSVSIRRGRRRPGGKDNVIHASESGPRAARARP